MKIYDIYVHKKNKSIIQIDSFIWHMNEYDKPALIVFANIKQTDNGAFGSSPLFNGYGTKEEIMSEYDLLVPQEDLDENSTWDDVFELVKHRT